MTNKRLAYLVTIAAMILMPIVSAAVIEIDAELLKLSMIGILVMGGVFGGGDELYDIIGRLAKSGIVSGLGDVLEQTDIFKDLEEKNEHNPPMTIAPETQEIPDLKEAG